LFQLQQLAVVLADATFVGDAAYLGRGVQPPASTAFELGIAAPAEGLVAIPDVADGDGRDLAALLFHFEDGVDVLLAAAADAQEGDPDAVVGTVDAGGAGGGEGQGRAGSGRSFQEVPAVDGCGHERGPRE